VTRTQRPNRLVDAKYARLSVSLTFTDGCSNRVRLTELGIRPADYKLKTLRVSSGGACLLVDTLGGETIELDSSTLRSDLDPTYAVELRDTLIALRGPIAELEKWVINRLPSPK